MHQLITGAAIVTRPTLSQLTKHLLLLSHAPLAEISLKRPVYNRMGKSPYAYTQAPVYPRVGSPAEPRSSQPPQQRLDLRERCLGIDRDVGITHLHERGQVWTTLDELLVATATHLNQMPAILLLLLQDRVHVRRHALPIVIHKLSIELSALHDIILLIVLDSEGAVARNNAYKQGSLSNINVAWDRQASAKTRIC